MGVEHKKSDIENVVQGGFCVGCGGCASVDSNIEMTFTDYGTYKPILPSKPERKTDFVCPFSNQGPHENELGASIDDTGHKDKLGIYTSLFVGHVTDEKQRLTSSSGGCATWLVSRLFETNLIDYVIHVKPGRDGTLFEYAVSETIDECERGAKTRYYPVEASNVISFVRDNPGKYAFVGIPCYIKMIKRLAMVDKDIESRIKYTLSIFCGHMKSAGFAESLAWQLNVTPKEIQTVDFRHKVLNLPANEYGFEVTNTQNNSYTAEMRNLYGKDWGMGAFRLKACDFCDDIVGELADVSFGDAWLDDYKYDSKGNNIIIIRNKELESLFREGRDDNALSLNVVSSEEVVRSQDASFRHRRHGVRFRVAQYSKRNQWSPLKREFKEKYHTSLMNRLTWTFRGWYSYQTHKVFLKSKQKLSIHHYILFSKIMVKINKALIFVTRAFRAIDKRLARGGR